MQGMQLKLIHIWTRNSKREIKLIKQISMLKQITVIHIKKATIQYQPVNSGSIVDKSFFTTFLLWDCLEYFSWSGVEVLMACLFFFYQSVFGEQPLLWVTCASQNKLPYSISLWLVYCPALNSQCYHRKLWQHLLTASLSFWQPVPMIDMREQDVCGPWTKRCFLALTDFLCFNFIIFRGSGVNLIPVLSVFYLGTVV